MQAKETQKQAFEFLNTQQVEETSFKSTAVCFFRTERYNHLNLVIMGKKN